MDYGEWLDGGDAPAPQQPDMPANYPANMLADVGRVIAMGFWMSSHPYYPCSQIGTALYVIRSAGLSMHANTNAPMEPKTAQEMQTSDGVKQMEWALAGGHATEWSSPAWWQVMRPVDSLKKPSWLRCELFPGFDAAQAMEKIEAWIANGNEDDRSCKDCFRLVEKLSPSSS